MVLAVAACGSSDLDGAVVTSTTAVPTETADPDTDQGAGELDGAPLPSGAGLDIAGLDIDRFLEGALAADVTTESCTLSGGAETSCYRITVAGSPVSHEVGPFCPETTTDGDDLGGIWFDGDAVYQLDGQFFVDLPTIYDDDQWQLHDDDGNVFVTETAEAFNAAARPDVDAAYQNHCIEGRFEWLANGEPVTSTVLIPTNPVMAETPSAPFGTQGITLDGVVIAGSAPVPIILGAYTIAAFDDCGGHFNPFEGYHLHGATGCSESGEAGDNDTPMFGYALDGFPVHSPFDDADLEAAELDECNGHATEDDGYHYHANSVEKNLVITCLMGQSVASEGGGGRPAGGPPPGG